MSTSSGGVLTHPGGSLPGPVYIPQPVSPARGTAPKIELYLVINWCAWEMISWLPSAEASTLFTCVSLQMTPLNPASSRSKSRFGRPRSPNYPVPHWKTLSHGPIFILLLLCLSFSFPSERLWTYHGAYLCHCKSWRCCKSEEKETCFWDIFLFLFLKSCAVGWGRLINFHLKSELVLIQM